MKIRLRPVGRLISGNNEVDVVTKMRKLEYKSPATPTALEKYMKQAVNRAKKLAEWFTASGVITDCNYKDFCPKLEGSIEEQCKNFIAELAKNKLITILEN